MNSSPALLGPMPIHPQLRRTDVGAMITTFSSSLGYCCTYFTGTHLRRVDMQVYPETACQQSRHQGSRGLCLADPGDVQLTSECRITAIIGAVSTAV